MIAWIEPAFWASFLAFSFGILSQLWTFLRARSIRRIDAAVSLHDAPVSLGGFHRMRELLSGSWKRYHFRSSRAWSLGCLCYHGAILLVVGTCASAILAMILFPEARPPEAGIAAAAIRVVGCASPEASANIFGSLAPWIQILPLVELPLALTGNALLLFAFVRGHHGRIGRGLDGATAGISIRGRRKFPQLVVRLTILAIIATEFLGRDGTRPWAVSLHVLLALWLAGIFPFTHLRHVLWSLPAMWFAWQRRSRRAIA
ncbi:MAG TPA: hypothetical protein PKO15_07790 [Fibrobacteria bacterium]|nr:hypothetical protein [Fibrobacteria bacterium]